MATRHQWLSQWIQESQRVLPLLTAYRDALVRRDLAALDTLHARLQPALQRLERLRSDMPQGADFAELGDTATLQAALQVARAIDEVLQSAYDIILNELDYTHALMAMLSRAAEREHYSPMHAPSAAPALMLNTEV